MLQSVAFASVLVVLLTAIFAALSVHASNEPATGPGTGDPFGRSAPAVNLNVVLPVYLTRGERGEPEVLTGVVVPDAGGDRSARYDAPRSVAVRSYAASLPVGVPSGRTGEEQVRLDVVA
jgi:hypothetical protein